MCKYVFCLDLGSKAMAAVARKYEKRLVGGHIEPTLAEKWTIRIMMSGRGERQKIFEPF